MFPSFTQMNEVAFKRQYLQIIQKSVLIVAKRWLIVSGTIFRIIIRPSFIQQRKEISNLVLYILMLNQWLSNLIIVLAFYHRFFSHEGALIVTVRKLYVYMCYMVAALST